MNDKFPLYLIGIIFAGLAAVVGATNGMIYLHAKAMADKGLKSIPVCVQYKTIWVGGGMVEDPIKNAKQ